MRIHTLPVWPEGKRDAKKSGGWKRRMIRTKNWKNDGKKREEAEKRKKR